MFDRSQVEELPPPAEPVPLDPPITTIDGDDLAWALGPLSELAGELGCTVVVERMPSESQGGYFDPFTMVIGLNEQRTANHQVKTLVHEVGHALIRQLNERCEEGRLFSYSEEELVVESVAYTVCGTLGLDTSGYSIPYLASWSEQAGLQTIQQAAKVIDEIAKRVEDKVTEARDDGGALGGDRSCAPGEHTAQTA